MGRLWKNSLWSWIFIFFFCRHKTQKLKWFLFLSRVKTRQCQVFDRQHLSHNDQVKMEDEESCVQSSLISPTSAPAKQTAPICQGKHMGFSWRAPVFQKTVSLSPNFLRRSVWPCFRLEKKKKSSWGTTTLKKARNSVRTLPPFTFSVVQRCVCFQKCEQTFVIIRCHFHPVS